MTILANRPNMGTRTGWIPLYLGSKLLFWGKYSEISGGRMPNKKIGTTDYLTISGITGSETYQTPNTAPYIAADTDYVWFKTNSIIRVATTADLVGYDFSRTLIRYDDFSPNVLREIAILSDGQILTSTELDDCYKYFWLSIYWNNILNGSGHLKDNRTSQQSIWTPETVLDGVPSDLVLTVINDTTINFTFTKGSTTEDGFKVERSLDGTTWSVIQTLGAGVGSGSDNTCVTNTRYYYRVRAFLGAGYSNYSNIANDWTAMKIPLSATGTGSQTATVKMSFSNTNVVATLDGNGTFETGLGQSITITAGSLQIFTIKVTSGNSNLLIFHKNNLISFGNSAGNGYFQGGNAPIINGLTVAALARSITSINLPTTGNIITGDIIDLPSNAVYIIIRASNTINGTISAPVSTAGGSNSISTFDIQGSNKITNYRSGMAWGDFLTTLTILPVAGGGGLSSSSMDNLIIDLAASITTSRAGTFDLRGANAAPTAASATQLTYLRTKRTSVLTN